MRTYTTGVDGTGTLSPTPIGLARTFTRLHRALLIALTALLLAGGFAFMPATTHAAIGDEARTTDPLNLRTGPSLDFTVIAVMPAGATVTLRGAPEHGFYPVSWNGKAGFAHGDYLAIGAPATVPNVDGSDGYSQDEIVQIIYAAADTYGQPRADMLRVATCESNLDPGVVNASSGASGLFQFMPGTWQTTPFADQDIFDPVASANAAGWMWENGRRGEWSCQ